MITLHEDYNPRLPDEVPKGQFYRAKEGELAKKTIQLNGLYDNEDGEFDLWALEVLSGQLHNVKITRLDMILYERLEDENLTPEEREAVRNRNKEYAKSCDELARSFTNPSSSK